MDKKTLLVVIFCCYLLTFQNIRCKLLKTIHGNHTIVALVNIYGTSPEKPKCSMMRPSDGILPVYSLIHAVRKVNEMSEINSTFRLGLKIYDVCDEQRLQNTILSMLWIRNIASVIGPTSPDDVSIVGVTMNLYQLPVINFNPVPLDIDYRPNFDTLYWIVPRIRHLAHALMDFMSYMKWNFVGLIHQNNKYGWGANQELKKHAEEASICFASTVQLNTGSSVEEIKNALMKFARHKQLSVIVLILEETELIRFLQTLKDLPPEFLSRLQFLSLSKWGTKQFVVSGNEKYAKGVITFQASYSMDADFEKYYYSKEFSSNPAVLRYTNALLNKNCEGDPECLNKAFGNVTHSNVAAYVDSVYIYAGVFLEMYRRNKSDHLSSTNNRADFIRVLLQQTKKSNIYPFKKSLSIFGKDRSIKPQIAIYNYQNISDSHFEYRQIGHWSYPRGNSTHAKHYFVDASSIQWTTGISPISTCCRKCTTSEVKVVNPHYSRCCWECVPCKYNEIKLNNTCKQCLVDERANKPMFACEKLPRHKSHIPSWMETFVYTWTAISCALTLAAFAVFIYYRKTHLVRASSRELTTFIFIGLLFWDCSPIFMALDINRVTCFTRGIFLYIGYSLVYAPLFLKTNRVYRIFQNGKKCTKPPKAVSPLSQVLITMCFCSIQVMVCLIRLTNIEIEEFYPENENIIIIHCGEDMIVFSANIVYVLCIMGATTFYAFKTRHFPKNYNESKYIGITMYVTCFISAIGLVSYFAVEESGMKSVIMAIVGLFCSNAVLVCLFTKKFYVLLKREEKKPSPSVATTPHHTQKIEERINTDCTNIDTEFTIDEIVDNNKLSVATDSVPHSADSPQFWDIRRISSISMLSILRIQRSEELKKADM